MKFHTFQQPSPSSNGIILIFIQIFEKKIYLKSYNLNGIFLGHKIERPKHCGHHFFILPSSIDIYDVIKYNLNGIFV